MPELPEAKLPLEVTRENVLKVITEAGIPGIAPANLLILFPPKREKEVFDLCQSLVRMEKIGQREMRGGRSGRFYALSIREVQ